VLFAIVSIFPVGLPHPVLFVWFFLFSVCSSGIVIMGFTSAKELFPVEMAGTSVGAVNLFPFLGGAVFMPLLGRVLDRYTLADGNAYGVDGYAMVLRILLVAAIFALACTLLMKETYHRHSGTTEDQAVLEDGL